MKGIAFLSGLISSLLTSGIVLPAVAQITSDKTTNTTVNQNGNKFNILKGTIANVSGDGGGSFQVQSRVFQLLDNSFLAASNIGDTDGGTVSIRASEGIEVVGAFILVDTFGTARGNHLLIETDRLRLSDRAFVTASTYDGGAGGGITINAKEVLVFGNPDGNETPTGIVSDTYGQGQGGNMTVTAEQLIVQGRSFIYANSYGIGANAGAGGNMMLNVDNLALRNGSQVATVTYGKGNAGNITVTATESVEITGFNTFSLGDFSSGLFSSAQPGSMGNSGNLRITSPMLEILQGGKLSVNTLGSGNGGNIIIRAEKIKVADLIVDFGGDVSGLLANVATDGSGNGGSLDIEAKHLDVYNGGQITASTDGAGNAGIIDIRADQIDVSGQSSDGLFPSAITSSSTTNFDAGSINLKSNQINIRDGAEISVSGLSGGNSGNLNINADTISLDNQGSLQANVAAQNQGNINSYLAAIRINHEKLKIKAIKLHYLLNFFSQN